MNRIRNGVDDWFDAWIGWSQPPVREDSLRVDSVLEWCQRCGLGVSEWSGAEGCRRCSKQSPPFDGVLRLGSYQGELRDRVMSLKYHRRWEHAGPLGNALGMRFQDGVLNASEDRPRNGRLRATLVVPIPMPPVRRFLRGIDHTWLLAASMARQMGCRCRQVLSRADGVQQVGLRRTERVSKAAGGGGEMRIRRKWASERSLEGLDVVLVDDVLTTGRTARTAAECLQKMGPSRVLLAVLAVSEPSWPACGGQEE